MQKWKKCHELLYPGLAIFLTALLCAANAQAFTNTVFSETGNYSVYAKGVGLEDPSSVATSGNIQLNIVGSPVMAYLYWIERDLTQPWVVGDVDNTITFQKSGSSAVQITGSPAGADADSFCFKANITNLVTTGINLFTLSGLDNERNPGAGILVIASDGGVPSTKTVVLDGCDFFFYGTPGDENSDVITFSVGSSSQDRLAKAIFFVGDAQTDVAGIRENDVLYLSSAAPSSPLTSPAAISLGSDATGLVGNDGESWDTFGRFSGTGSSVFPCLLPGCDPDDRGVVTILAGHNYANFQFLSPPPPPPAGIQVGISAVVTAAVFQIDVNGCTPGYWKQPQHFDSWPSPYASSTLFELVFGRNVPGDPTLLNALKLNGGGLNALMRHSAAALLNAASSTVGYAYTTAEVISMFQAAFDSGSYENTKDLFDTANNAGCLLN